MCVELEIDMEPTAHSWKMLKTSGGTLKWLKCVASWVIVVARWCSTVQPLGASMSGLPLTTFCHGTANEVMLDNYEWINVYNMCIYIYIGSQCDSETARGVLNLRTFVFVVLKKKPCSGVHAACCPCSRIDFEASVCMPMWCNTSSASWLSPNLSGRCDGLMTMAPVSGCRCASL